MPSLYNVIEDVKNELFPNGELNFRIKRKTDDWWYVYMKSQNGQETAKVEFMIDDDDESIVGCVLRHGDITRKNMERIMDAIISKY